MFSVIFGRVVGGGASSKLCRARAPQSVVCSRRDPSWAPCCPSPAPPWRRRPSSWCNLSPLTERSSAGVSPGLPEVAQTQTSGTVQKTHKCSTHNKDIRQRTRVLKVEVPLEYVILPPHGKTFGGGSCKVRRPWRLANMLLRLKIQYHCYNDHY